MQESFFRKKTEEDSKSSPPEKLEIEVTLNIASPLKVSYEPYSGLYEVTNDTGFSSYILIQEELPELNEIISTEEDLESFTIFLSLVHQDLFYAQKATRLAISKESKDSAYILDALEKYLEEYR